MKQILTNNGRKLILSGLAGATIEFTKIKFGNGEEQGEDAVDLSNPIMEIPISTITSGSSFITLGASYKNTEVPTGFSVREIGVFAKDPDDENLDILYHLWYEEDSTKADYVSPVEDRILNTKFELLVFVDDVENVTAILAESEDHVSKAEFNQHINNTNNPHNVTKNDVGLGNVPNVTPENQRPIFENKIEGISVTTAYEATAGTNVKKISFLNIESGETIGTILRKIRAALSVLLGHVNEGNPHFITPKKIGAAAATHYHSANAINAGILSITRGGTGGKTDVEARANLGFRTGQGHFDIVAGEALFAQFSFEKPFDANKYPYVIATPMMSGTIQLEFGIRSFGPEGFEVFAYSPTYSGTVNFNWIACL